MSKYFSLIDIVRNPSLGFASTTHVQSCREAKRHDCLDACVLSRSLGRSLLSLWISHTRMCRATLFRFRHLSVGTRREAAERHSLDNAFQDFYISHAASFALITKP